MIANVRISLDEKLGRGRLGLIEEEDTFQKVLLQRVSN